MSNRDSGNDSGFLCPATEVVENELREVMVDGPLGPTGLILTRHDNIVHGWLNVCPHQGRALNWAPDRFLTDDQGRLVCAAHGAVFALPGGECVSGPCRGAALTPVDLDERADGIYWRSGCFF